MRADGSHVTEITHANTLNYDPAWSPDGRRIAFVSTADGNPDIYTMRPDGTGVRQLTKNDFVFDEAPNWSPDGTHIVFTSDRGPATTRTSTPWIAMVPRNARS